LAASAVLATSTNSRRIDAAARVCLNGAV
jgi:hypothetical protein